MTKKENAHIANGVLAEGRKTMQAGQVKNTWVPTSSILWPPTIFSSSFPLSSVQVQRPMPSWGRPLYFNTRQGKGRGERGAAKNEKTTQRPATEAPEPQKKKMHSIHSLEMGTSKGDQKKRGRSHQQCASGIYNPRAESPSGGHPPPPPSY